MLYLKKKRVKKLFKQSGKIEKIKEFHKIKEFLIQFINNWKKKKKILIIIKKKKKYSLQIE